MTDYNPPDDTEIATAKAIKATTGRRLRDMSIAMFEGADDAPRISADAFGSGDAGDELFISLTGNDENVESANGAFYVELAKFYAFGPGTYRISGQARYTYSGGGNGGIVISKNGTSVYSETFSYSASFADFSDTDVSLVAGDVLQVSIRGGDSGGEDRDCEFKNVVISTDTDRKFALI